MQGEFPEAEKTTLIDSVRSAYADRKPASEFFNFGSFTVPISVDEAFTRSKRNIPKFLFYYICISLVGLFFAVLTKTIILIPLAVCIAAAVLAESKLVISGIAITPSYALYGCIAIIVLLALISTSIVSSYLVLLALSAITTSIVLAHACLLEVNEAPASRNV